MLSSRNKDLFSFEFSQDPYPTFKNLRENEPIHLAKMNNGQYTWVVTKYEDAVAILKDPRFTKNFNYFATEDKQDKGSANLLVQNMLFSDPPDHTRLRGLVHQAFTPRMIESLRGRIEEITHELLDAVQNKGYMNLINDFAFPLPIIVICELLGVPSKDRNEFRKWSNTLVDPPQEPERIEELQTHLEEFVAYLQQWFEQCRENPQNDLISKLIQAEEDGDRLKEEELYGIVSLLIIAGHETTVNLITNGVYALLTHPDQKVRLQNEPNLIKSALEEILRYNGPVQFSTNRWATETIRLGDKTIHEGDQVLVALNSANHDPEQFQDPEVFDITRGQNKHLAFGKGIHYCLGAPLARLEGEIAITALLKRMPEIRLATEVENLKWKPGMLMRGLEELPVLF
ncbi:MULTISPECIES: cytochrome P450 [Paenibacillus]|uniref:Cytochrome P450 n=1 Tax=Paenibacillus campinasensis TaxID=66347 RepID=A0A268EHU4_9BACL|nr:MULTISPECIES: cytochrome P450 [Paenibacillus]PAD72695.1 cytochrome P450 [Paenibacillus campinasensis]PAK51218.1 cytochrome P450 [Paenibacillus sp. 7541]